MSTAQRTATPVSNSDCFRDFAATPTTGIWIDFQCRRSDPTEAMFDLTLLIRDRGSDLECVFLYDAGLYDDSTIARLTEHYQNLLAGIVADPQERVATLPLLSAAERQQLLLRRGTPL